MDAVAAYSFANLAWLGIESVPLIVWPGFISSLLRADHQYSSPLEDYFARSLGFALLVLGLVVVVLSGAVPLTSVADGPTDTPSPYATPTILLVAVFHTSAGFQCWSNYAATGKTAFLFGTIGSAVLTTFGLWCLLFAGDRTRLSRNHGFDKHTSGFPFKNAESYRARKKAL